MTRKSFTPNLDAVENQIHATKAEFATVLLLRAGFTDLAILLNGLKTAIEDSNRLTIRALRNDAAEEQ